MKSVLIALALLAGVAGAAAGRTAPSHEAVDSAGIPTGHHLARFACQAYSVHRKQFLDQVLVLEQVSSQVSGLANGSIDGSVLVDPEHEVPFTDVAEFRMRIHDNESLVSGKATSAEVVERLLAREASPDERGELMDYTGEAHRWGGQLAFESTDASMGRTIRVDIFWGAEGIFGEKRVGRKVEGTDGMIFKAGDDVYFRCGKPVLVPETSTLRAIHGHA